MNNLLRQVEFEFEKRGISEREIADILSNIPDVKNRRIIAGYASVSIVDREGHRITVDALRDAVDRFMKEPHYRAVNIFHSDVVCGRVLPKWTDPSSGEVMTTHVDDIGFWAICELRDDVEIADKVWDEIQKGNIRSFSIAGSSKQKEEKYGIGGMETDITELDLYEITLCEQPVNQLSVFSFIWDPDKIEI